MTSRRRRRHDLVVIGGGSAGLIAADFGARLGADVLLIERDRIGGDCTWTGCVPSKALLHATAVAHQLRAASAIGVHTRGGEVDFPEVMQHVRQAIAAVYSFETPEQLRKRGIEVELGEAHFLDQTSVDVAGRRIHTRNFVICTGAVPQRPPLPGLEAVRHLTYEEVFADLLLVATGRQAEVEGLLLACAGVEHDERGIHVDQNLKTSQDHTTRETGSFQFTHYAGWHWSGWIGRRPAATPSASSRSSRHPQAGFWARRFWRLLPLN